MIVPVSSQSNSPPSPPGTCSGSPCRGSTWSTIDVVDVVDSAQPCTNQGTVVVGEELFANEGKRKGGSHEELVPPSRPAPQSPEPILSRARPPPHSPVASCAARPVAGKCCSRGCCGTFGELLLLPEQPWRGEVHPSSKSPQAPSEFFQTAILSLRVMYRVRAYLRR